jgi:hypothetical protein
MADVNSQAAAGKPDLRLQEGSPRQHKKGLSQLRQLPIEHSPQNDDAAPAGRWLHRFRWSCCGGAYRLEAKCWPLAFFAGRMTALPKALRRLLPV